MVGNYNRATYVFPGVFFSPTTYTQTATSRVVKKKYSDRIDHRSTDDRPTTTQYSVICDCSPKSVIELTPSPRGRRSASGIPISNFFGDCTTLGILIFDYTTAATTLRFTVSKILYKITIKLLITIIVFNFIKNNHIITINSIL